MCVCVCVCVCVCACMCEKNSIYYSLYSITCVCFGYDNDCLVFLAVPLNVVAVPIKY